MADLLGSILKDRLAKISLVIYLIFAVWWVTIFLSGSTDGDMNHLFGFAYGGFAIWGGMVGLSIAHKWGGMRSYMGRAIIGLSSGLLLQAFGQYSFWFSQSILKIELPYPSIPDIGFFGTIPCYFFAGTQLAAASGVGVSLRNFIQKIQAILIPAIMLAVSYALFLKNYTFDLSNPLITFFDFGYPMGSAIYISVAILTYLLSRKILGGIMKSRILILIIAFTMQYISEYSFIYFQEEFFPAHFVDFFYLTSYFLMAVGLIQLKTTFDSLKSKK